MVSLLEEKVSVPKSSRQLVARPRLTDLLSGSKATAVSLVIAPAGYGKTTLVSSWLSRQKSLTSVWLSLDSADQPLSRCMRYLLFAFVKLDERFSDILELIGDDIGLEKAISVMDEAITILDSLSRDIVLVVDNFHVINDEQSTEALTYLIEHGASNLRCIVISRKMPHFNTSKLRLENKLCYINEVELAFTLSEVSEYLRHQGLESFETTAEDVYRITKGWPAFIVLAGDAAEKKTSREPLEENKYFLSIVHEFVSDQLIDSFDEEKLSFILTTSQIEPFCASLAEEVTGLARSTINRIVYDLIGERFFVSESHKTDSETWFSYHPLVSKVLRQRFHVLSEVPIEQVYDLASSWLEQHGKLNVSAQYAKWAKDWEHIVRLIDKHWRTMGLEDNVHMLYQWGKMVPRDYLAKQPKACSILSFASVLYGDATFTAFCESVARRYFVNSQQDFYLESLVFHLQVCNVQGRRDEAREVLPLVLPFIDKLDFYLAHLVRQHEVVLSDNPNWLGFRDLILELLPETYINCSEMFVTNNYTILSFCEAFLGNFSSALAYADKGVEGPEKTQHPGRAALINIHYARMTSAYYRGNLRESRVQQEFFDLIPREHSMPYFLALSSTFKAIFEYLHDDIRAAAKLISSSRAVSPYGLVMVPLPFDMMLLLEKERLFDFGKFTSTITLQYKNSFAWQRIRFVYDYLFGQLRLLGELEDMIPSIEEDRRLDHINARVLLALYYEKAGRTHDADKALRDALDFAEYEDIVQPFYNNSSYFIPILSRLDEASIPNTFAHKLFVKVSQINTGEASLVENDITLTSRENEILYQIVSGYKTEEIAERLGISKTTVRKHVANIYQKYDVHSRTQLLLRVM